MREIKKILIMGFGLFAMFFGAGDVLLPPLLGAKAGNSIYISSIAFILTAVGLPLLSLHLVIRKKGDYESLFSPMGKYFGKGYLLFSLLLLGPIIAVPRTAATTFELGILPLFPNANSLTITAIFFIICIILSLKKGQIIDEIGRYLTPMLVILLCLLIVKGFLEPGGVNNTNALGNAFMNSFLEGYNTLSAVAAVFFGKMVYETIKDEKNINKMTIMSIIISAIVLSAIFFGLMYLGYNSKIPFVELSRSAYLIEVVNSVLGRYGTLTLSIIVTLACLTTAIGLVASVSDFFEILMKGKVSYRVSVFATIIVSFAVSQLGVDKIISTAAPILLVMYPVMIVIIILNNIKCEIVNDKVIAYCTYTTLIVTIFSRYIYSLPLRELGLEWIIPTLIVFIISVILNRVRGK